MPSSPKYIKELISLYAKPEMKNFRNLLIAKVESLKNFIKSNEEICSLLRQEINFNEAEKRKDRFLNDVELGRLKQLLEDIRPTDVVLKIFGCLKIIIVLSRWIIIFLLKKDMLIS